MNKRLRALVFLAGAGVALLTWFLYQHVHKENEGDVQQTNEACQSELTDVTIPEDNVAQNTTECQTSEDDFAQTFTEGSESELTESQIPDADIVQQTSGVGQSQLTTCQIPEDHIADQPTETPQSELTESQISKGYDAQQADGVDQNDSDSLASETDSSSAGSYKSSSPTPCYHSLSTVDSQDQLPQSFDFANPQAEWQCSSDFEGYCDTNICADVEINHDSLASGTDSSSAGSYKSSSPTPCFHSLSTVDSQDQLPQSFDCSNLQAKWHCTSDFEGYIEGNISVDVGINHVTSASDSVSSSCYSYVSGSPCYHSVSVTSGASYDEPLVEVTRHPSIEKSDSDDFIKKLKTSRPVELIWH